jgi:hypothetical protein
VAISTFRDASPSACLLVLSQILADSLDPPSILLALILVHQIYDRFGCSDPLLSSQLADACISFFPLAPAQAGSTFGIICANASTFSLSMFLPLVCPHAQTDAVLWAMLEYCHYRDATAADLNALLPALDCSPIALLFIECALSSLDSIDEILGLTILPWMDMAACQSFDFLASLVVDCSAVISDEIIYASIEKLSCFPIPVSRLLRKLIKHASLSVEFQIEFFHVICGCFIESEIKELDDENDPSSDLIHTLETLIRYHGNQLIDVCLPFDASNERIRELGFHLLSFLVLYTDFGASINAVVCHLSDPCVRVRNAALWALHSIALRVPPLEHAAILLAMLTDHPLNAVVACEIICECTKSPDFSFASAVFNAQSRS